MFNRRPSRRPKPLFGAVGLFTSTCLVAVMTLWATSSPFSPLSQQSNVETTDKPVSMLQKVKDAFALSDSVLPSPTIEPIEDQVQHQAPPALTARITGVYAETNVDESSPMEESHALQQEDRSAWRSFRRQNSMLVTKPIARAPKLPMRNNVGTEAANLPEVHFASADPRQMSLLINSNEMGTVPSLPNQIDLAIDKSSLKDEEQPKLTVKEQPQARIATRNIGSYSSLGIDSIFNKKQPVPIATAQRSARIAEKQPTPIATQQVPADVANERPPERIATLPVHPHPYIAPFGNNTPTRAIEISPTLPPKSSWETGLY